MRSATCRKSVVVAYTSITAYTLTNVTGFVPGGCTRAIATDPGNVPSSGNDRYE